MEKVHFVHSAHFVTPFLNKQILCVYEVRSEVQKRNDMCFDIFRHKQQKEPI